MKEGYNSRERRGRSHHVSAVDSLGEGERAGTSEFLLGYGRGIHRKLSPQLRRKKRNIRNTFLGEAAQYYCAWF